MKKILIAGSVAALLSAPMAFAYEQGDMLVRVGVSSFDVEDAEKDEQLGVDFAYILTGDMGIGQIGIEGSLSMPVEVGVKAGAVVNDVAEFLPLTVTAQYYFNTGSIVTPYVGVGLNYMMVDSQITGTDMDDSIGAALQVGADFAINDNWGVNLNVRNIDVKFDSETKVAGATVTTENTADTTVVSIAGAYKF